MKRLLTILLTGLLIGCERPAPPGAITSSGKRQGNLMGVMKVPEFTFLEAHDRALSRKELDGKVWLCSFIFTNCATHCPPMAMEMSELQDEFLKEDFRILSVTVDPARDTPEKMRDYLNNYDYRKGRWFFVRGKRKDLMQFAFDIGTASDPDEPLNHSVYFALVDKKGTIRDLYSQQDHERMQTLRKDIRKLLAE